MPSLRLSQRGRPSAPGLGSLLVLLVFLGLVLSPLAGTVASQDDPANEPTQDQADPTEMPGDETQEPIPPTQIPTELPPTEPAPTLPAEPVPTEVPPTDVVPPATLPAESTETAGPTDGPASTTTLVMISGTCDIVIGTWPQDAASLADVQAMCDEYTIDNTFTYTYLDTGATQRQTTTGGTTAFAVDPGSFRVESVYPPGMNDAIVGCESASGYSYLRTVFRGYPPHDLGFSSHKDLGDTLTCYWYNLPPWPTIINLIKGECDVDGFDPYTATTADLAATCAQNTGDATFTFTHEGTGLQITQTTVASNTSFDVPHGNFTIQEDLPAGYGDPMVSCFNERYGFEVVSRKAGGLMTFMMDPAAMYTCHWYNVPLGPDSDLIIHKRICPPGYDPAAPQAAPLEECTATLDGVVFEAEGDNGDAGSAQTGDDSPGVAVITNLEPGAYTVHEDLPPGYASAFVWSCTTALAPDGSIPPVAIGTTLTLMMVAGWDTTCFWFNVPEVPITGSITVIKYICGPVTWWSLFPCPILKTGQAFKLLRFTGVDWQPVGTGITGRDGRLTWTDLTPGTYLIDELGGDWCRIESDNLEPGGKGIVVNPGEDAMVHVSNCVKRTVPTPIPFPVPPPFFPGPREW